MGRTHRDRRIDWDFFMGHSLRTMIAWTMTALLSLPSLGQTVLDCGCAPSDPQRFTLASNCCCSTPDGHSLAAPVVCRHCGGSIDAKKSTVAPVVSLNKSSCRCSDFGPLPCTRLHSPEHMTRNMAAAGSDCSFVRPQRNDARILPRVGSQSGDFWRPKLAQIFFGVWLT